MTIEVVMSFKIAVIASNLKSIQIIKGQRRQSEHKGAGSDK